jgi:uncharacterized protein YqgV (UPF0045/DUF77 family)
MSNRTDIINAVSEILEEADIFYKVYKEPTDIEKERSFPVAWIELGQEYVQDADMTKTCSLRVINLEITIGVKHGTLDTNMNTLIDTVFDLIKSEYTLKNTAINLVPMEVVTDRGYFHPYSFASLIFKVWTR